MFHAPVGNASIIDENHKVKVFMSGYCVAGSAGIKYLVDVFRNCNQPTSPEDAANNSFNTDSMKSGITNIVSDLNLDDFLNINKDDFFSISKNSEPPILLTQALCPVIIGDSWQATKVWSKLKNVMI